LAAAKAPAALSAYVVQLSPLACSSCGQSRGFTVHADALSLRSLRCGCGHRTVIPGHFIKVRCLA
jgi:hypothetical protein